MKLLDSEISVERWVVHVKQCSTQPKQPVAKEGVSIEETPQAQAAREQPI